MEKLLHDAPSLRNLLEVGDVGVGEELVVSPSSSAHLRAAGETRLQGMRKLLGAAMEKSPEAVGEKLFGVVLKKRLQYVLMPLGSSLERPS